MKNLTDSQQRMRKDLARYVNHLLNQNTGWNRGAVSAVNRLAFMADSIGIKTYLRVQSLLGDRIAGRNNA